MTELLYCLKWLEYYIVYVQMKYVVNKLSKNEKKSYVVWMKDNITSSAVYYLICDWNVILFEMIRVLHCICTNEIYCLLLINCQKRKNVLYFMNER